VQVISCPFARRSPAPKNPRRPPYSFLSILRVDRSRMSRLLAPARCPRCPATSGPGAGRQPPAVSGGGSEGPFNTTTDGHRSTQIGNAPDRPLPCRELVRRWRRPPGGLAGSSLQERQAPKAPAEDDNVRFPVLRHVTGFIQLENHAILEGALARRELQMGTDGHRFCGPDSGLAPLCCGSVCSEQMLAR